MTAGDLYLAALDEWFSHGEGCQVDACEQCVLLINRVRLARKVWQSSRHPVVTDELYEIRELRRALEADAADLWRVLNAVKDELRSRWWITESRGSYAYDDDRYRDETRHAFEAIQQILDSVQAPASTRFLDVMRRTDRMDPFETALRAICHGQTVGIDAPALADLARAALRSPGRLRALLDDYGNRPQGDFMRGLGHIRSEASSVTNDDP